jgi:hypothetical protein
MKEWEHRDWAWLRLRVLRSAPPGLAARSSKRAKIMSAALDQAEQLARGAAQIGPETKPLLLFYSLSQAGRAIAAVHLKERWELTAHGLTWLGPSAPVGLLERHVAAHPLPTGSFQRVAEAVGSDSLSASVELGAVWSAIWELAYPALPFRKPEWRTALWVEESTFANGPGRLHGSHLTLILGGLNDISSVQAIQDELGHYPSAQGGVPQTISADPRDIVVTEALFGTDAQGPAVVWEAEDSTVAAVDALRNRVAPPYQGSGTRALIPQLPNGDWLKPIMLWWLLLFGFSNAARYEPKLWTEALDVNRSPLAVPLESAMEEAIVSVPHFILEALTGGFEEPLSYTAR